MGQDYNETSDMLQASDVLMPTATSSNVAKLPEFKIQFHPRSNQPPIYQSYEEFHVCSEKSPSPVDKTPWSPFCMLGDFEFVEIALAPLLNQQQVNALLGLFARVTQGAVQVTLKNDAELHKACDAAAMELTPWLYRHNGVEYECFYDEPWIGDYWWDIQLSLPNIKNAMSFGLILYADKSNLSSFSTAKSYPVIVHCANLLVEIWNNNVIGRGTVVSCLPIVPKDAEEEGKLGYTTLKHVVWHKSFKKLLLEIEQYSKTGTFEPHTHTQGIDVLCVHATNRAKGNELLKWLGLQLIEIEANIEKYVASFPHWQNLTHFNQVIHVTLSDGNKLADISKQIFYTGINVLKKSITPEGLISLDVQTKHMVNMINDKILTFDQTLKDYTKCVVKSNIDALGPTKVCISQSEMHMNTIRTVETFLLRLCVDHLEKPVSGESDPEVDAVSEHTSVDHIKLGAHVITTQTLKDLEENGQPDMVFHQFHQRFSYGYQVKSWISLPTDFMVKEYCYLLVNYKLTVTWNQCTDCSTATCHFLLDSDMFLWRQAIMAWVSAKVAQAIAAVSPAKTIHMPDEYLLLGNLLINLLGIISAQPETIRWITLEEIRSGLNVLPHGIWYFGNPENCATTDLDLRSHAKLEEVERLWRVPWRMWPTNKFQMGVRCGFGGVTRCRWILNDTPTDGLDNKYRYWSYVETHPTHVVLSQGSQQEAVDVLHWSYTDWLLAHPQPIQPPFSQEECQEPLRLLNDPSQQSTILYTHMVACILLCTAHWHQTPMLCMAVKILIGILCLGIPFLFMDRVRYSGHFDVEGNYKAELLQGSAAVHHAAAAAHEGFIFLPCQSILLSLPLVFLAYSVAGKKARKKLLKECMVDYISKGTKTGSIAGYVQPLTSNLLMDHHVDSLRLLLCVDLHQDLRHPWPLIRRIKGGFQSAAYDAFNSDAEDGGPEDFNLDEGMDNIDLENLDSDTEQHRQLTHVPRPQADVAELQVDGKLKGALTELYEMIPVDLHESMVTYKQFGSVVHFIQAHSQERSNVLKVIKDCAGMLFTPYNISPDLFTGKPACKKDNKACLVLLKKDGVGEYTHFAPILFADPKQMVTGGFLRSPILVKVIHVLMFGKSILTENKHGWPPARGQKMGMLSVTEGLIAGACILVQFLLLHDPELSATGAETQVNYQSEYNFYLEKLFKASPWAVSMMNFFNQEVFRKGSQLANVESKVFANVEQLHSWEDEFLDKLNNIDPTESHTPPVSTLHDLNAPGSHDSDLHDSNLSSVSHAPSPVAGSVTHFNPPHSHPASVTAAQADLGAQTISGASR
ncbi:hypothetical protein F5J12DRAFT_785259 [Pisolithus orientalis]|uniref:uncharacterized protein n=1 Tax=Pisolithus orientalis TaxID=936130 RepID=UPI00222539D1|nr:uncharacterized protein F5J12DRAFT_785259 [Pisolithus orientalis]KAI5996832.1 hypothetical protein F5J12DRAFT_785259 [Pisolithus orientalis]